MPPTQPTIKEKINTNTAIAIQLVELSAWTSILLTTDSNDIYICSRNQNSNFWRGLSGYGEYCIPDVDTTLVCSVAVGAMSYVGGCNMVSYISDPFYSNYECCYDD